MNTASPNQCPQCGQAISGGVKGLCPNCLAMIGFGLDETSETLDSTGQSAPGAAQPLLAPALKFFGDYELLAEIARGGMGVVYRARQVSLNRVVAVKMILGGRLTSDAEVKRFHTEAEAAANLRHPNIVAIHEIGEHEGRHYFSMDLIAGCDLAKTIGHQPLPSRRAVELVKTLAEAVHYAHQRGTLHRDLKPQNVLMDADGRPHITDFGLAKQMHGASDLTQDGSLMGSPSYMSPEQASGKSKEVTTAADVYALGAVLYETLTGRPPFRADSVMETLQQVIASEPKSPRELNDRVDRDLETICLKCLEKDPERRYGSAGALADELGRWLRNEPVLARPATTMDRARKWARREPAQVAVAAVVALALLLFIGGVALANRGLNQRYWQSLLNLARAERSTHDRARSLDAITEAARIRTDSRLRDEAIQTLAQAGVRAEQLVPYGDEAWFTLSDDGALLMAAGMVHSYTGRKQIKTPKVKVWETANARLVNEIGWDELGPLPTFSPDTRVVALPQTNGVIAVWEPRTGKVPGRVNGRGPLRFSPDGQWLAISESNRVKVVHWSAPAKEELRTNATFLTFTKDGDALVREGDRVVRWNAREGTGSFVTPAGLQILAVNRHGTVAALWEPAKPGTPAAPRPATDIGDPPGSLIVFDLVEQKRLAVLPTMRSTPTAAVRFNADGRLLAFPDMTGLEYAAGRQVVRIYEVEAGRYRQSLAGVAPKPGPFKRWRTWWHTNHWNLDFNAASPSAIFGGEFIGGGSLYAAVTGLNELYVTIWNTETGETVATLPKSAEFALSADGRRAASMSKGSFVHYGNGDTYAIDQNDRIIAQTSGTRTGAKKLPRGTDGPGGAVTGTAGVAIQLWSVVSGVPTIQAGTEVHALAFSRDGGMLAAGGRWANALPGRLWNVSRPDNRLALHPVTNLPVEGMIFFAGTNAIWEAREVSGHNPAEFQVVVRQLVPVRREFPAQLGFYNGGPAFSPDGSKMIVSSYGYGTSNSFTVTTNQTRLLWDLPTQKLVAASPVKSSDWSPGVSVFCPDGKRIATSAFVRQGVDLLDAASLKPIWHAERSLLTATRKLRIRIGELFGKRRGNTYDEWMVSHLAFTPDGKHVASVAADYLMIRNADTGAELGVGYGHEGYIQSLAISPEGGFAVTGGLDLTIRVWEIPTARELAHWHAHDSAVTALAFSADGVTLASGSVQGMIKLWNLPELRNELKMVGLNW